MPAGLGRPGSLMEGPCLQMMLSLWGPPSLGPREAPRLGNSAAFLNSQQFYFAQLSLFPRVVGQSSSPSQEGPMGRKVPYLCTPEGNAWVVA